MALYSYEAFSKEGKKVKGSLDAPSLAQAREILSKQGLYPIRVERIIEEMRISIWRRLFAKKISAKEKILFTKQLAILLKSGVPLLQALELLTEQFEGTIRSMLITIKDEVKEGSSLADALKKYSKTFDAIYIQLVRAGEASGKLEIILERLTSYLERREEIAKRISKALQYPMMQLLFAALVVIVLLTYIVPQMTQTFEAQGQELPLPTRILMILSNVFTTYYIPLIIFIGIVYGVFYYWRSSSRGARQWDQFKLRLPLIKYIAKTGAIVQFSYTLGILLEGGVNLADALDIVVNIVDNKILARELQEARDKIVKQGKITQYLKKTGIFPSIAIYLIRTGEESGELATMLLTVARNYEIELSDLIDGLTAKIGPIMLIVMAVIVGFVVLSIALPIIQMNEFVGF